MSGSKPKTHSATVPIRAVTAESPTTHSSAAFFSPGHATVDYRRAAGGSILAPSLFDRD